MKYRVIIDLMSRHIVVSIVKYDDVFFQWLRNQFLMVEDYAYASVDFHVDLDLSLPDGSQWRDIGKKEIFCLYNVFDILMIYNVFCVIYLVTNKVLSIMNMWGLIVR